jgi:hypothetical protein
MRKKICATVVALGLLWALAIAGGSDLELVSFQKVVAQEAAALTLIFVSMKIGGFEK